MRQLGRGLHGFDVLTAPALTSSPTATALLDLWEERLTEAAAGRGKLKHATWSMTKWRGKRKPCYFWEINREANCPHSSICSPLPMVIAWRWHWRHSPIEKKCIS
ncbi:unnamed protein product [Urochloa humidicola]